MSRRGTGCRFASATESLLSVAVTLVPLLAVFGLGCTSFVRLWDATRPLMARALARETSVSLAAPITIGDLSIRPGRLVIRNVQIDEPHGSGLRPRKALGRVAEVQVSLDGGTVARLLHPDDEPVFGNVDVVGGYIHAHRDRNGQWNLLRLIRPSERPPTRVWVGRVRLRDCRLDLTDEAMPAHRTRASTAVRVSILGVTGELTWETPSEVAWSGHGTVAGESRGSVGTSGRYDSLTHYLFSTATVDLDPQPEWANRFLPDGFTYRYGSVHADAAIVHGSRTARGNAAHPRALHYAVRARMRDVLGRVPWVRGDVSIRDGEVSLVDGTLSAVGRVGIGDEHLQVTSSADWRRKLSYSVTMSGHDVAVPAIRQHLTLLPRAADGYLKQIRGRVTGYLRMSDMGQGLMLAGSLRAHCSGSWRRELLIPRPSDVYVRFYGRASSPTFDVELQLPSITVAGVSARDVYARLYGTPGSTSFVARADMADGRLNILGGWRGTRDQWQYEAGVTARDMTADSMQIAYERMDQVLRGSRTASGKPLGGVVNLDARVRGNQSEPIATGETLIQVLAPKYDRMSLDRAELLGTYQNGRLTIRRAVAESGPAVFVAEGTLEPRSLSGSLTVECDSVPLSLLADWAGQPRENRPSGLLALRDGRIAGDIRHPRLSGSVYLDGPKYQDMDADYAVFSLDGTRDSLAVDGEFVRLPAIATVQGFVRKPLSGKPWISARVQADNLAAEEIVAAAGQEYDISGMVRAEGYVEGSLDRLRGEDVTVASSRLWIGDLEVSGARIGGRVRSTPEGMVASCDSLEVQVGDGLLHGTGEYASGSRFSAALNVRGLPLGALGQYWARYGSLSGTLHGSVQVAGIHRSGDRWQLDGSGEVSARDLLVNGESVGDLYCHLAMSDGIVTGALSDNSEPALQLTDGKSTVTVESLRYDIGKREFLASSRVSETALEKVRSIIAKSPVVANEPSGPLARVCRALMPVTGKVSADVAAHAVETDFDVTVRMDGRRFQVGDTPLEHVSGSMNLTNNKLIVEALSLQSGELAISAAGELEYGKRLSGTVSADGVALSTLSQWLPPDSPLKSVTGRVDTISAEVSGTPESPEVTFYAAARGIGLASPPGAKAGLNGAFVPAARVSGATLREGLISIDDLAITVAGSPQLGQAPVRPLELHARARMPFSYRQPVPPDDVVAELSLELPRQGLEAFRSLLGDANVELVGQTSAKLDVRASVGAIRRLASGESVSPSDVQIVGDARLTADRIRFGSARTMLKDVNLDLRVADGMVEARSKQLGRPAATLVMRGTTDGAPDLDAGEIEVRGAIPLIAEEGRKGGLEVVGRNLRFEESPLPGFATGRIRGEFAGDNGQPGIQLRIDGSVMEPTITGSVALRSATLRLPATDPLFSSTARPGVIDPRFDIAIAVGPNVSVTNSLMVTSLSTASGQPIRFTGSLSAPRLAGSLVIEGGKLTFPTARFMIARNGRVDIRYPAVTAAQLGETGLDVRVNLKATANVTATSVTGVRRRYRVTVEAQGPLMGRSEEPAEITEGRLRLTYRTEPPDLALSQSGLAQRMTALLGGQEAIQAVFSQRGAGAQVLMGQAVDYLGGALLPDLFEEMGLGRALGLQEFALDYSTTGAFVLRVSRNLVGPFEATYWRRISGGHETVGDIGAWELRIGMRLRNAFRLTYSLDSQRTNAYLLEGVYSF